MDTIEAARQEAERLHFAAVAAGNNPLKPLEFACAEAYRHSIKEIHAIDQDDSQLNGARALFDSQAQMILYEDTGSEFYRALLVAHELAHIVLEGGTENVITNEINPTCSAEDSAQATERIIDYGCRERREVKMDLFAREFLLPRPLVRDWHVNEGLSAAEIAERVDAPLEVVQQQLLDALLLPPVVKESVPSRTKSQEIDPIQIEAAAHRGSPFQLQAGPGTGKTQTLVHRIESLLEEGVDPMSILVLTFSNKAAGELSERVASKSPDAAAAMWIGTFHAFGLDIIHRFYDRLGFPKEPTLIERIEAIELLEDELARLPLKHFRNLWDPVLNISDMLSAVSRAKDEVVNATAYLKLSETMLLKAGMDSEAQEQAQKCHEVALLFKVYEKLLTERNLIDFGDLVAMPVRLVESDAEIRSALANRHQHILVDEYQDVNRASVRLLKAIAGDSRRLWVVGDARQSIYRFRGASSINMARFKADFPGATIRQLEVNYRSSHEIVETYKTFSYGMSASKGALPLTLKANRGSSNALPELRIARTTDDEIAAVTASIEAQKNQGIPYNEQVVLCTSNSRLSEMATGLEESGIPVLYLGSLFERSEIKDLLALLSLVSDPYMAGLTRVATIPTFSMGLGDVKKTIDYLKEIDAKPLEWCNVVINIPDLSTQGRTTLVQLANIFQSFKLDNNPWDILVALVLEHLNWAQSISCSDEVRERMKGIALWQFLNFCRRQPKGKGVLSTRLLNRIRRLNLLSEDRDLRKVPIVALEINAVRLMTIHGSKGLEFKTVHMPGMIATGLPRINRPPRCVPPNGLIEGTEELSGLEAIKIGQDEEEECIFFVGMSRARDQLFLYASSVQSNGNSRCQSKFIDPIRHHLHQNTNPALLSLPPKTPQQVQLSWKCLSRFTDDQIALFDKCPKRFFYTHILKLGGRQSETAFMRMHDAVREVLGWVHASDSIENIELSDRFHTAWSSKGPIDHGYDEDYKKIGWRLIEFLIETRTGRLLTLEKPLTLTFAEGEINVVPDEIVITESGETVIRRIKTGKLQSDEFDALEYTILHLAVKQAYGTQAAIEAIHLTSETRERVEITPRKINTRRDKAQEALRHIQAGFFPARPESRRCPRCPHFFICGDIPNGSITIK